MNVVANAIVALFVPAFSEFSFTDLDGQQITLSLGCSGLFMFCIFKIVGGMRMVKQGKLTLAVFNPVLKEYALAESGATHGITMTKRISKDMGMLRCALWRIFCGCTGLLAVSCIFASYWACEQSDNFLQVKFDYYAMQVAPAEGPV